MTRGGILRRPIVFAVDLLTPHPRAAAGHRRAPGAAGPWRSLVTSPLICTGAWSVMRGLLCGLLLALCANNAAVATDATAEDDACCTAKCCRGSSQPCCHPGPPCKAQQNQTACAAAHCLWTKGKCAPPPPPPPPPPPVLPCTITPLPPAPAPPNPRWASYWGGPPKFLNGSSADYVTRTVALLKANGGPATVTSMILMCGDTIGANGSFVPAENEGCAGLIPQLNAMGIGAERSLTGSAAGLRLAFKNPDAVIADMVAMAKQQKLKGFGSDYELSGTNKADALGLTCFQAKLRAALRPLGARVTMFNDGFNGIIDDLPDLQKSVDRLLEGDTYFCALSFSRCPFIVSLRANDRFEQLVHLPYSRSLPAC